ncbi:flagellar FliJ protein [Salinibacillus kushneri]|uniref:Flagellar FliJ protein n=1 Tax=Salinibacillus kushneri TaxID=237682 RepID=A0A1I0E9R3_9BACI|nr:flagellar export protein FliJ [Salinibacillus kushneri]SET41826.1 flagellar FliJ protein [Salinibacillus kushneri]
MSNVKTFEKILNVKMIEKDKAHKNYQEAMDYFEVNATELYYLLKEKEDFEAEMSNSIQSSVSADQLRNYDQYIQTLNQKIKASQQNVQSARTNMELKQQSLTESYIELKKYEKIVSNKKTIIKKLEEKHEREVIDEASVQQFIRGQEKVRP